MPDAQNDELDSPLSIIFLPHPPIRALIPATHISQHCLVFSTVPKMPDFIGYLAAFLRRHHRIFGAHWVDLTMRVERFFTL